MPSATTHAPLPPADAAFRRQQETAPTPTTAQSEADLPTELDAFAAGDTASNATSTLASPASEHAGCLPPGTKLRQFVIERVLGEGGFGVVYAAYDLALGRRVAIKEYMPAALAVRCADFSVQVRSSSEKQAAFAIGLKSFVNEARLLAQLDHPSLAKVFQFWSERGTAYLVMPYYTTPTLATWLRERRHAPIDEAWLQRYFLAALDALSFLHGKSCLHRDVSPQNLLVVNEADPLLLDFGAARRVVGAHSAALTAILKPGYAPLEQYEGNTLRQGPWTDLYALSAVMYQAMVGTPPPAAVERVLQASAHARGDSGNAGASNLHATLQRTPYSPALIAAVEMGLALHPRHRPQTAEDMATLIRLSGRPASIRSAIPAQDAAQAPARATAPSDDDTIPTLTAALCVDAAAAPRVRRPALRIAAAVSVVAASAVTLAVLPAALERHAKLAPPAQHSGLSKPIGAVLNEPVRAVSVGAAPEPATAIAAVTSGTSARSDAAQIPAEPVRATRRAGTPAASATRRAAPHVVPQAAAPSVPAQPSATAIAAAPETANLSATLPHLLLAASVPAPEPASHPTAAASPERGNARDKPAPEPLRAIARPEPQFPAEALRGGVLKGRVTASFVVNADGSVAQIRIAEATPPRVFDRAVLAAVARWQFAPIAAATPASVEFAFDVPR
jgi:TonB family protein